MRAERKPPLSTLAHEGIRAMKTTLITLDRIESSGFVLSEERPHYTPPARIEAIGLSVPDHYPVVGCRAMGYDLPGSTVADSHMESS